MNRGKNIRTIQKIRKKGPKVGWGNLCGEYDSHASLKFFYYTKLTHTHTLVTYHLIFLPLFLIIPISQLLQNRNWEGKKKMALQAPTKSIPLPSSLAPATGNAGLRKPSDAFALKSSFFSPSLHLFLPAHHKSTTAPATAPKFTMRVASKQAYICRDCGYFYFFFKTVWFLSCEVFLA